MKKLIAGILVVALVAVLLPMQLADARGGRGRAPRANSGGSMGGTRGTASRSKKDEVQLREMTKLEDADSLRRAARKSRR